MFPRIPRPPAAMITVALLAVLTSASAVRAARLTTPRWENVTNLSPVVPPARSHHTMVMDPIGNQVIMWSGHAAEHALQDPANVWILDLCTMKWRSQNTGPKIPGQAIPTPLHGHNAVILPEQRKMIVIMGSKVASLSTFAQAEATENEVWELDLNDFKWSQPPILGSKPCKRWHAAAATFGPTIVDARIILFGGRERVAAMAGAPSALNDTWLLRQVGTSWEWMLAGTPNCLVGADEGNLPTRRYKHSLISGRGFGATADTLYAFGGFYGEGDFTSDVFRGSVAGSAVTWGEKFSFLNGGNFRRAEHSAIYDPVAARMIVLGGFIVTQYEDETPVNYLSTMALTATCPDEACWSMLTLSSAPSGRKGHAAVYDPIGDRMIVFGGQLGPGSAGPLTNETWQLVFSNVAPAVTDLGVDSRTSQTATLGWTHPMTNGGASPDICGWDLRTSSNPIVSDADFQAATPVAASYTQTPSGGTWHVAATFTVSSPGTFRHYALRSTTPSPISNDICFKLTPYVPCMEEIHTDLEGQPSMQARLTLAVPNPVARSFECSVTVPGTEEAVLTVHDVAGRSVERHELSPISGSRVVKIGDSSPLRPGFYMVILRQGANESRRSVIVR